MEGMDIVFVCNTNESWQFGFKVYSRSFLKMTPVYPRASFVLECLDHRPPQWTLLPKEVCARGWGM